MCWSMQECQNMQECARICMNMQKDVTHFRSTPSTSILAQMAASLNSPHSSRTGSSLNPCVWGHAHQFPTRKQGPPKSRILYRRLDFESSRFAFCKDGPTFGISRIRILINDPIPEFYRIGMLKDGIVFESFLIRGPRQPRNTMQNRGLP